MAGLVLQRTVFPTELRLSELYYAWSERPSCADADDPAVLGRRSVHLSPGTCLSTGTFFNGFFEGHWRRYTTLGRLALRLRVSGRGGVQLCRRTAEHGITPLAALAFDGAECALQIDAPGPGFHPRELGLLYFDLTARGGPVTLHQAEWVALDARPQPVDLVAGYCTFNREPYLLAGVRRLLEDADVSAALRAIIVIDQGTKRVADHPDFARLPEGARDKLRLVTQANFGGAGGFTRSILEALGDAGATHVLLMDDDAVVETESVFRTARFLALAREEMAVGGGMLDLLRPCELFEATAEVYPDRLAPARVLGGFRVDDADELEPLLEVHTTRYNGWWFMAFPLSLVERVGLPLPFFIRCDDIEYGCRLNHCGVPLAALPGVGVWHEPFYLKARGWQNYYEFRNMLVLCALHAPQSRLALVRTFLRRLVKRLLLHEYYEAWLLCRAVRDYCRGPEVLEGDPALTHEALLAARVAWTEAPLRRTRHLRTVEASPPAKTWFGRGLRAAWCLLREILRPSPSTQAVPKVAIENGADSWWDVARTDVAAVFDDYTVDYTVLRRSRGRFFGLLFGGLLAALRLALRHGRLRRQWRAARPRLTSLAFWKRYLGLRASPCEPEHGGIECATDRLHLSEPRA
jgi:galactofuranosylgalactofuranosylrhamnosyl-N-acetylglucosaminyl-diphospho-decaprenol beta-1,5/1,6-galactofuranosyltransferase